MTHEKGFIRATIWPCDFLLKGNFGIYAILAQASGADPF